MSHKRDFKLGIFVIVAVLCFLGIIFYLGMADLFTTKARLCTVFTESVQGIAKGSLVKYKGVPIGSVSNVVIQLNDKLIRVDMKIDLDAFIVRQKDSGPRSSAEDLKGFYKFFEMERAAGLRCRLEYAGITGMKYIELDYFDPGNKDEVIPMPEDLPKGAFYLPASNSAFNDIMSMLSTSLARISQIDYVGISNGLRSSLREFNALLSDPSLKVTIQQLERISNNIESSTSALSRTMTDERLNRFAVQLEEAVANADALLQETRKQVADADIAATASSFRNAADSVTEAGSSIDVTVRGIDRTRESLELSLRKLNRTLESLNELANMLNEDPDSVIWGKQNPQSIDFGK